MKQYEGSRSGGLAVVTVNGHPLDPRLDLRNHSPSGFEWGYAGSGPAQLALAVLADHFGNPRQALVLYQAFKFVVVSKLPRDHWRLTSREVDAAVMRLPSEIPGCRDAGSAEIPGGSLEDFQE